MAAALPPIRGRAGPGPDGGTRSGGLVPGRCAGWLDNRASPSSLRITPRRCGHARELDCGLDPGNDAGPRAVWRRTTAMATAKAGTRRSSWRSRLRRQVVTWLGETSRSWMVVSTKLADSADLEVSAGRPGRPDFFDLRPTPQRSLRHAFFTCRSGVNSREALSNT